MWFVLLSCTQSGGKRPQNVADPLDISLEPSDAALMSIATPSILSKFRYRKPQTLNGSNSPDRRVPGQLNSGLHVDARPGQSTISKVVPGTKLFGSSTSSPKIRANTGLLVPWTRSGKDLPR